MEKAYVAFRRALSKRPLILLHYYNNNYNFAMPLPCLISSNFTYSEATVMLHD